MSKILFLGTGSSCSTPNLKCLTTNGQNCKPCTEALGNVYSKNRRHNPSLLVHFQPPQPIVGGVDTTPNSPKNILIDCGKTFRESFLLYCYPRNIFLLDAVILTHEHADAVGGMDDLRDVQNPISPVPIYASTFTHDQLSTKYKYLYDPSTVDASKVGRRIANLMRLDITSGIPFYINDLMFLPLELLHGGSYICYGYAFGSPDLVVYLSDFNIIPEKTYEALSNKYIAVLILDLLRIEPHPAHPTFEESVEVAKKFISQSSKIGAIYFVGISHEMDHDKYNQELKFIFGNSQTVVELAYDGLEIPVMLSNSCFSKI